MDFSQWIDLRAFFIAFLLGLLFVYLRMDTPRVVYKYPTPWNAGQITYIDEANVCYKYRVERVECPADKRLISEIPLQFNENQDK
jgi:hypothetical protein